MALAHSPGMVSRLGLLHSPGIFLHVILVEREVEMEGGVSAELSE